MAATNAIKSLQGCRWHHRGSGAQTLGRQSTCVEFASQTSLWGRHLPAIWKPHNPRSFQRLPCPRALLGSENSNAGVSVGNGREQFWRRQQEERIPVAEKEEEPMPIELFVLADAGDDRDDELEDETLEEMDEDEALFDHEDAENTSEEEEKVLDELAEVAEESSGSKAEESVSEEAESEVTEDLEEEDEGEEIELSWAQEKYLDVKQSVGVVVDKVPGPRVASSSMPWLIAVPLSYLAITLLLAIARVIKKNTTPRAKKKRLVNRNLELVELIQEYFEKDKSKLDPKGFRALQSNFKFLPHEILRKYIRYALNEKPFDPEMVSNLLLLRRSSGLSDKEIVGVLNDISTMVVKSRGAVMMDTRGMTEKGIKKKAAVQAIFTKLLYLSELDEFLAPEARAIPEKKKPAPKAVVDTPEKDKDAPLVFNPEMLKKKTEKPEMDVSAEQNQYLRIKEIFGVTDDDANLVRIETLSDSDVVRLEALLGRNVSQNSDEQTVKSDDDEERDEERDEDS